MYRIVYISTAAISFSDKELEALLEVARKKNVQREITGLLILKGRSFLQCLEGPKKEVLEIFNTIKEDKRHNSIVQVIAEEDTQRLFPDWSMGYKNFNHLHAVKSPKLKDFSEVENINSLSSDVICEVFKEFVEVKY